MTYDESDLKFVIQLARRIENKAQIIDLEDQLGCTKISTVNWELISEEEIISVINKMKEDFNDFLAQSDFKQ